MQSTRKKGSTTVVAECVRTPFVVSPCNGVGHEFSGTGKNHYEIDESYPQLVPLAVPPRPTAAARALATKHRRKNESSVGRTRRKARFSKRYGITSGPVEDKEVSKSMRKQAKLHFVSGTSRAWPGGLILPPHITSRYCMIQYSGHSQPRL
jgi:hypothetical protein